MPDLFPLAALIAALAAVAGGSALLVRSSSRGRSGPRHLMVVAPESLEGLTVDVEEEVTLGRAAGCGITVDDGHVSPIHARLFRTGGHLVVESPTALGAGDHLQVGDTVLELW